MSEVNAKINKNGTKGIDANNVPRLFTRRNTIILNIKSVFKDDPRGKAMIDNIKKINTKNNDIFLSDKYSASTHEEELGTAATYYKNGIDFCKDIMFSKDPSVNADMRDMSFKVLRIMQRDSAALNQKRLKISPEDRFSDRLFIKDSLKVPKDNIVDFGSAVMSMDDIFGNYDMPEFDEEAAPAAITEADERKEKPEEKKEEIPEEVKDAFKHTKALKEKSKEVSEKFRATGIIPTEDVRKMVELRNKAANSLTGFEDFNKDTEKLAQTLDAFQKDCLNEIPAGKIEKLVAVQKDKVINNPKNVDDIACLIYFSGIRNNVDRYIDSNVFLNATDRRTVAQSVSIIKQSPAFKKMMSTPGINSVIKKELAENGAQSLYSKYSELSHKVNTASAENKRRHVQKVTPKKNAPHVNNNAMAK